VSGEASQRQRGEAVDPERWTLADLVANPEPGQCPSCHGRGGSPAWTTGKYPRPYWAACTACYQPDPPSSPSQGLSVLGYGTVVDQTPEVTGSATFLLFTTTTLIIGPPAVERCGDDLREDT
jgi:hypothetical protein